MIKTAHDAIIGRDIFMQNFKILIITKIFVNNIISRKKPKPQSRRIYYLSKN